MQLHNGHRVLLTIILYALLFGHSVARAQEVKPCKTWVAQVVSVEGSVQAKRPNGTEWVPVKLNDTFCPGDMIRVAEHSRAGVILPNEVLLRFDQNTTLTFNGIEKQGTSLIDLLKGAVNFFSRLPHGLSITTPFVNGTVEGTEFLVRVTAEQTVITVFEGVVAAANPQGSVTVSPGQEAIAQAGRAPTFQLVAHPRDAVQWALYYPPIIDYRLEDFPAGAGTSWEGLVRKSIERYGQGDLTSALSILCQAPEPIRDSRFFTFRAGLLLMVGRVDEASADIEKALALDSRNSRAFALKSVIAVVQNEKDKALELANKAIELDQQSATARMARPYALQARFDLKGALADIQEAVKLAPQNALAWARLSELWLSLGYLDKALDAAQQAVALNSRLARTQVVLGFAYLEEIKTKEAKEAFNKAIELDQGNPMARLGMGLAKIREGDLEEGRQEIEIAAILDPNNSLIRSYLGKAYFDEKRDKLSGNQLDAAKKLDPKDPTPWFYDGIRKLTINRPVEALQDVEKSIELNDNRAVYRSSLLMDSDLAARSAALGRVYSELGFQDLSLVEGWKSVNTDPADYSGHRLLADSYSALPRHEIARVSELLVSQLLQPLNVTPVPAYLAQSSPMILEGAGPAAISFNEFNPLFLRNRLALQVDGVGGQRNTFGNDVVQSGVWDNVSYSLSQYHYETDGFRKNNDQEIDLYDFFVQTALSPKTSVQAEYRYSDVDRGDPSILFDPENFDATVRNPVDVQSGRFGLHHSFSPQSDLLGSFVFSNRTSKYNWTVGEQSILNQNSYQGEVQHLFRSEMINITSGIGHFHSDLTDSENFPIYEFFSRDKFNESYSNIYLYLSVKYPKNLIWILGGSGDFYDSHYGQLKENQFNPKFGLIWNPFPSTTVRAAAFRSLKRYLIGDQTLEPTQVAGFNQFFDDGNGADVWNYGIGLDQKLSEKLFAGIEFSRRDVEEHGLMPTSPTVQAFDCKEYFSRVYLNWTPHPWVALSLEYQYEYLKNPDDFPKETDIGRLETQRVSLGVNFFHPSGFFAHLKPAFVDQSGSFAYQNFDTFPFPMFLYVPGQCRFWDIDGSIGYRLPKRLGVISVEFKNLTDKQFRFQDTDPANPSISPGRLILGRFTLSF
jgi:tetratricopeptide (TPR) repeat protein